MIERIVIENFKSIRRAELKLGGLNVFIGANASGKSNFFDALKILQGLGYGFNINEILNGKAKSSNSEIWEGIRGGSSESFFRPQTGPWSEQFKISIDVIRLPSNPKSVFTYSIAIDTSGPYVSGESLRKNGEEKLNQNALQSHSSATLLSSLIPEHLKEAGSAAGITWFLIARELSNAQRLDLKLDFLRDYSRMQEVGRMGENGENFAALVKRIGENARASAAYIGWLKELRTEEIENVAFLNGAKGDLLFALKEGHHVFPATVLSEGTLRFAALTAAFFQPDMPSRLIIEEIETGIHASRFRLLVELLRGRAGKLDTQVFVTTHSPLLLDWLDPEDYQYIFLCKRDEDTGESHIRPLTDYPEFNEVVIKHKQPIGELLAQGWLESAL